MTRKKISDIRREELIHATIAAVYEHGFADLTVAQIAKDAEVSTGSIHYYFGGKDALLEATMRYLLTLLKTAYRRRLEGAETPYDRLHAVVQANFDDHFLTKETCRVWTQFWAFAHYHKPLARLHQINRARVKSNILYSLKELVQAHEIQIKTNAIQGYMDGIRIQTGQAETNPNLTAIQDEVTAFVDQMIGRSAVSEDLTQL